MKKLEKYFVDLKKILLSSLSPHGFIQNPIKRTNFSHLKFIANDIVNGDTTKLSVSVESATSFETGNLPPPHDGLSLTEFYKGDFIYSVDGLTLYGEITEIEISELSGFPIVTIKSASARGQSSTSLPTDPTDIEEILMVSPHVVNDPVCIRESN